MALYVDIRKSLGAFKLDVQLQAESEILALLGASGCGKSMTLKCIAGIETPDSGKIVLDGRVLYDSKKRINLPPQQRKTGYLFQNYALFPNLTVEENIAMGIPQPKQRRKAVVAGKVKAFFLEGLEKHYPAQLSGGQQQRVALARMLASEPQILMLDEPFSALDSYLRWQLEQELRVTLSAFGGTTLYVSHNRDEVYRLCDRITVLKSGRVDVCGEKWSLFDTPQTLSACLLTGCKNISAAARADAHSVEAKDWGLTLVTAQPVDPAVTHIGVRAHCLRVSRDDKEPNRFEAEILQVVEDTFSVILMVRNKRLPFKTGGAIRWEVTKEQWAKLRGQPLFLAIPPEAVLLLRD